MREIKFRAWDGERMNYAHDGWSEDTDVYSELWDILQSHYGHAVMQYTGLKDANGTEIYEGDILSIKAHHIKSTTAREVEWCEDNTGWYANLSDWPAPGSYSPSIGELLEEFHVEVIGNIHENPELLERDQ